MMLWMTISETKDNTLKVLCGYLNKTSVKKGLLDGHTWRTLRVPDRRHGGQGHPEPYECTW